MDKPKVSMNEMRLLFFNQMKPERYAKIARKHEIISFVWLCVSAFAIGQSLASAQIAGKFRGHENLSGEMLKNVIRKSAEEGGYEIVE